MRHDDYVYTADFEASDYWAQQRAENESRLGNFRLERHAQIEAKRRKMEQEAQQRLIEQLKEQERLREQRVFRQEQDYARAGTAPKPQEWLAHGGVQFPAIGIGPPFVVPGQGEKQGAYIRRWVAFKHGLEIEDLAGPRRFVHLVVARQEMFYEMISRTNLSLCQIANFAGGRDHTTVLHGVRKHAERNGLPHIRRSDKWARKPVRDQMRGPDGMFIKEVIEAKEIKKP